MNGGFSQQARVLSATIAGQPLPLPPSSVLTIDGESDPGAWATALAHSTTMHCACCGLPAHSCAVVQDARAEALADSADGAGGECNPDEDSLS